MPNTGRISEKTAGLELAGKIWEEERIILMEMLSNISLILEEMGGLERGCSI